MSDLPTDEPPKKKRGRPKKVKQDESLTKTQEGANDEELVPWDNPMVEEAPWEIYKKEAK